MRKSLYVKDLKAGERIEESFLVVEKNLAYSLKGAPYLNLRLRDRTGEVDGKIWENALEWDRAFKKGDVIKLDARVVHFRNVVQLSVSRALKLEESQLDPADYFRTTEEDPEAMLTALRSCAETIADPPIRALLQAFFGDEPLMNKFKSAPAAKGFHHMYVGGLLEHTLSVVRLLEKVADHYGGANRDLLIAGGILHDIGKIRELSFERLIDYSDEGRLIGHIAIGLEILDEKISVVENFPKQTALELRHILLSHHGVLEYGSPKRPKTVEALMVHYVDDLDAKVNAFREFIRSSGDKDSDWTPFHRLFERFLYRGSGEGRSTPGDSQDE